MAPATKSKPPVSKTKPTITLEGKEAETFETYAVAAAVVKIADAGQKEPKAQVLQILKQHYLKLCIAATRKIDNPDVVSPAGKASFQVKHVQAIPNETTPDGKNILLVDRFKAAGFDKKVAVEIMTTCIHETSEERLKSFTELAASDNPVQKKIGERIMKLIEKTLAEEDRALMVETVNSTWVDACWRDVAVSIACRLADGNSRKGVEILGRLFSVLPIQPVLTDVSYGGELSTAFAKMLPVATA
jgi:hypothetical protein